jgi:hypothetical protein
MERSLAGPLWSAARKAARNTPEERDRAVDLMRSFSLLTVVFGHLFMALVVWKQGAPVLDNLLAHVPALQLVTWVLQIMPVFFFAGAIANQISWTRAAAKGVSWREWTYDRLSRLIRPVAVYLAAWVPFVLISTAVLGSKVASPLATLSTQLLWFLGVYLPVTAATPLLGRWVKRSPWGTPLCMLVLAGLGDWCRLALGWSVVGLLNFLVVWGMAAALGLVMEQVKPSKATLVGIALAGLVTNVLLVSCGPWPLSMVGLPGERFSNMSPPSLVLGVHCWVLAALVSLAKPALARVARRERVWTLACAIGGASMTLYLWHLTALISIVLVEHGLGIDRGVGVGSLRFWGLTVLHFVMAGVLIWTLVTIFAPLENRPLPWLDSKVRWGGSNLAVGIGIFLCSAAFLILAATGMAGFPFSHVTHYAGLALTPGLGFVMLGTGVVLARYGSKRRGGTLA